MKTQRQKKEDLSNNKWKRSLLFVCIFVLTYFILITAIAPKKYDLKEGDIAIEDIKAPRDIVDEEATTQKENELTDKVGKQYTLKGEIKTEASDHVTTFFNKLINLMSSTGDEKDKIDQLRKLEDFKLTDSQYKILLELKSDKATEMQWVLKSALEKVYDNNIKEDNETVDAKTVAEAKKIAADYLAIAGLEQNLTDILQTMAYSQIKPNFIFDKDKTNEKITEALKSAPKVMIKKNQLIVKEGEPITAKQIKTLEELGYLSEGIDDYYLVTYLVLGLFTLLILSLQYLYLKKERKAIFNNTKLVLMIGILNLMTLLLGRILGIFNPFIIPIACGTIIMAVLIDYKMSMVINILNLALLSVIIGFNPQVLVLGLVNVIIFCTSLKKVNGRNDILYSTAYLIIGTVIITMSTGLILSNNVSEILSNTGFAGAGSLLSGILAIGILPFLEMAFNIVTNIKLLELSNPNSPLLKRLLMEAPGTYHHSIMVANLAEIAAEAVEANPILARVGAYYHDIGKIKRPGFFGENQLTGENPHNKMKPNLSANIILAHTRDGLDLAKEYKLPKVIQDIIVEHHGTTLVKYFYFTYKNSVEDPESVREEEFKYGGPIPSSKEAAIIMVADSVEAAVRSIKEPNKDKVVQMVNNIIKDKLYSDQLNNSDLTLTDVENIRQCFLKVLTGIYHQRVEYPKEK